MICENFPPLQVGITQIVKNFPLRNNLSFDNNILQYSTITSDVCTLILKVTRCIILPTQRVVQKGKKPLHQQFQKLYIQKATRMHQ